MINMYRIIFCLGIFLCVQIDAMHSASRRVLPEGVRFATRALSGLHYVSKNYEAKTGNKIAERLETFLPKVRRLMADDHFQELGQIAPYTEKSGLLLDRLRLADEHCRERGVLMRRVYELGPQWKENKERSEIEALLEENDAKLVAVEEGLARDTMQWLATCGAERDELLQRHEKVSAKQGGQLACVALGTYVSVFVLLFGVMR